MNRKRTSRNMPKANSKKIKVDIKNVQLPKSFVLNNGIEMPALGLSTCRIKDGDTILTAMDNALQEGCRLFETSSLCPNARHLKRALNTLLPKYGLIREDIFIVSKLAYPEKITLSEIKIACLKSLQKLDLEYFDLFMIKWLNNNTNHSRNTQEVQKRQAIWNTVAELYDDGLVNSIGVSQMTVAEIQEITQHKNYIIPAVNQVEWNPYSYRPRLLRFCREKDILVQGYDCFGKTTSVNSNLLQHPVVNMISKKVEAAPVQVLLTWTLQKDIAVITKSTDPYHTAENNSIKFKISDEDMNLLDNIGEK